MEKQIEEWRSNIVEASVPAILAAYKASLSSLDRTLLTVLQTYDGSENVDFKKYSPILWGSQAETQYANLQQLGPALWNRPTEKDVLDAIDASRMRRTALEFPLHLSLSKGIEETTALDRIPDPAQLYDPRFLLPLLASILKDECIVDCRRFVERNCLSLTFAALSSHCSDTRSLGYLVLSRYHTHLMACAAADGFEEKPQFLCLITQLKNSLERSNQRLSWLLVHFLIRISKLFLTPQHPLYAPVNTFLLMKASLDLENVPEFYKLFHSCSALNFMKERVWLLESLVGGLREAKDYRIIEKRYGFKLILSFFDCPLADAKSRELILQLLIAASTIRTAVSDLCRNYNFIGWLSSTATSKRTSDAECKALVQCLSGTVETLTSRQHDESAEAEGDSDGHGGGGGKLPSTFLSSIIICADCMLSTLPISASEKDVLGNVKSCVVSKLE